MNRIQVKGRRFSFKAGNTFLGVWERGRRTIDGGVYYGRGSLSFVIPRPDAIDRKQIRALILQKMGATKECER
jgi:hypothetical protein